MSTKERPSCKTANLRCEPHCSVFYSFFRSMHLKFSPMPLHLFWGKNETGNADHHHNPQEDQDNWPPGIRLSLVFRVECRQNNFVRRLNISLFLRYGIDLNLVSPFPGGNGAIFDYFLRWRRNNGHRLLLQCRRQDDIEKTKYDHEKVHLSTPYDFFPTALLPRSIREMQTAATHGENFCNVNEQRARILDMLSKIVNA